MSKKSSPSATEENVEKEIPSEANVSEKVETAENVSAENYSGGSNSSESVEVETRYGLTRFLQLNPQSFYVESLLRSQCAGDVMTLAGWLEKINAILNKKMQ